MFSDQNYCLIAQLNLHNVVQIECDSHLTIHSIMKEKK